ncbi:DEAD/DEAH box helicase family protein [Nostoc sp. UCD121]|uniref:DEAD/DEAH box helicase n=1 Tax=unclassified Nostoc TaxID=2593658 RepID=UPI001625D385|nr:MULTISPECIES: SNF2-related protein [unclassified Nostoc]MBC1222545.1 DEAD/DEAH box helicase family protein [Nostoc sp. UCD120]MBC1280706.1 DEAD/DEAH box helicase family protein [Nostoc sp. UCD121]
MEKNYTFKFNSDTAKSALKAGKYDPLNFYEARLNLFNLSVMADYDQLICLPTLTAIDKYWYQIETARKVLRQLGGRALLADEVGLGKTIEAGLIIAEYLARGMVQSMLVLTPASLVSQWQSELSDKFNIATITTDNRDPQQPIDEFWTNNPRIIASLNTAKSAKHYPHVTSRTWDLVVVDEAHHLKNRTTLNWKLVNALNKRFILMLTATPVQNSLIELFNLLTLLKPGLLQTEAAFKKEYVDSRNGRVPKNPEKLRSLMREVMVRNTRALVDVKLPKRFATTITVTPAAGEEKLYQDLSEYLRNSEDKLDRLSRTNLLMRAGSSPGALADSLKQLTKRLPDEELKSLARRAAQVKQVEKAKVLVEMLSKSSQKTLVFTTHKATSTYLAQTLLAANIPFAEFTGGMSLKQKDEAIAAFRDTVSVLLASETGGEGRNIQFANAIVNYDLPWNPMKIEQRIGRIHRIGQTQDVFIFNFCLKGSIEEYILRILHDKINMFELVVGEIETILGNVDDEFDFSEIVMDIWLKHQVKPELDTAFEQLADNLLKAKNQYQQIQELDEQIFGEDFEA